MPSSESNLVYVAPATVQEATPNISVPDDIVEAGIVEPGGTAFWSFEAVTGTLLLSNREPEMDAYKPIREMSVQTHQNLVRFPGPLQDDPERVEDQILQEEYVHENAVIEPGKRYHFVYRDDGMASGEVRSCYLFSDEEIVERLSDPDDWEGNFAEVPEFF